MTGKSQYKNESFAWSTGDAVDSEWTVRAIEFGVPLRIRMRASRGGDLTVALSAPGSDAQGLSGRPRTSSVVHRGVDISWEPPGIPSALVKPLLRRLVLRMDACAGGQLASYVAWWSAPVAAEPQPRIQVLSDSVQVHLDEVLDDPTLLPELLRQLERALDTLMASGLPDGNTLPAVCVPVTSPRFAEPVILEALVQLADIAVAKTRKPLHLDVGGGASLPAEDSLQVEGRDCRGRRTGSKRHQIGQQVRASLSTGAPLTLRCSSLELRSDEPSALTACPTKPVGRSRVGVGGGAAVPPSFSVLAGLLDLAAVARRRFRLRSPDGHPLCLFPADRAAVKVPGAARDAERRRPQGGSFYGSSCDGCSLRADCLGVSRAYLDRHGEGALQPPGVSSDMGSSSVAMGRHRPWTELARLVLTGHPDERVFLGELIPSDDLPPWPCVLPWTRLELAADDAYGPCCADYMTLRAEAEKGASPQDLWNGPHMQAIRQAMTRSATPHSCRDWCPVLASGQHRPENLLLRGGSADVVEGQIRLVEDMLAGAVEVRTPPLEFCAAATAQCNFRCVMCPYGETPGHPGDELPESFWTHLLPWLGQIRTLDINGGEPLVSRNFRRFVETTDFSRFPQLALHVTTNGSLLTPSRLARYRGLPFSSLTISVNAAVPDTYLAVNRGVPWATLRKNLDALVRFRSRGDYTCFIRYSMVILKANLDEIRAFADMARADGVGMRFLLPVGNRNQQTIMDDPDLMQSARDALADVLQDLVQRGLEDDARDLEGILSVLDQRLRDGELSVL